MSGMTGVSGSSGSGFSIAVKVAVTVTASAGIVKVLFSTVISLPSVVVTLHAVNS